MLCVNTYPQAHIDGCRKRIAAQLAAYRAVVGGSAKERAAFDGHFFANLVVVLDASFMHRSRTLELKDGNAMNEVRMLSASVAGHQGVLAADKSIKYDPARSVLGLKVGDPIAIDETGFTKLAKAYFNGIEATFT